MRTNELRIGNHVLHDGKVKIVVGIDVDEVRLKPLNGYFTEVVDIDNIYGIRLTPMQLEYIGFVHPDKRHSVIPKDKSFIYERLLEEKDGYFLLVNERVNIPVPYIHTLQNLYYALYNEELPIIINI